MLTGKLTTALVTFVLLQTNTCHARDCPPSSCGKIHNISYPFRLKGDPKGCGDQRYELGCENKVTTVLALYSGRYYVEAIDYNNYTIQVVDPDVYNNQGEATNNCSILIRPRYSLSGFNFSYDDPYQLGYWASADPVTYLNCANQVVNDSRYVDAAPCVPKQHSYSYAVVGSLSVKDVKAGCQINMVARTSWFADDLGNYSNISYTDIQRALVYGFPLSWIDGVCEHYCGKWRSCYMDYRGELNCFQDGCFSYDKYASTKSRCGFLTRFGGYAQAWYPYILISIGIHLGATFVLGTPFIIILSICTWRRSIYPCIIRLKSFFRVIITWCQEGTPTRRFGK